MEQWRRRLSITMDSAAPDAGDGAAQDHDEDMTNEDNTAGGNYEFIANGDRKQTGMPLSLTALLSPPVNCSG